MGRANEVVVLELLMVLLVLIQLFRQSLRQVYSCLMMEAVHLVQEVLQQIPPSS